MSDFVGRFIAACHDTKQQRLLAVLGLILATLCWGGNSVAGRLSVGDIPPVALSFWRWTTAMVILLSFSGKQLYHQRQLIWQYRSRLILLALVSITSFNTILYLAAQSTQAVNLALIQTSLPVMAMVLSIPLLKIWPQKNQVVGGLIAIPGLLMIFSQGNIDNLRTLQFGQGDLLMMMATFCWASYTVLLKRFYLPISGVPLLTTLVTIGVTMLAPFYFWEFSLKGGFELSSSNIGLLTYVVLFPSLVAYLAWNYGVKILGASQAAMFNFLIPIFAASIAIPVLGEPLENYHLLAAVFIFAGLWLTTRTAK